MEIVERDEHSRDGLFQIAFADTRGGDPDPHPAAGTFVFYS
jgi:hypothetical protein